jgi:hypothetical protein
MKWKCYIPGKSNTDWDGGFYPLSMEFTDDYPAKPPKVTAAPAQASLVYCCAYLVADLQDVPACYMHAAVL